MNLTNQNMLLARCASRKDAFLTAINVGVTVESFEDPIQADLWRAIGIVESGNIGFSYGNIAIKCKYDGTREFIDSLKEWVPDCRFVEIEELARLVIADAKLKAVKILSRCIMDDVELLKAGDDLSLVEKAMQTLHERTIAINSLDKSKTVDAMEQSLAYLKYVEKRNDDIASGRSLGISTGIAQLDESLGGGYLPNQYVLLAARTGAGKTQFAVNAAYNAYMAGHKVLFFSAEMPRERILDRIVSRATGIDSNILLSGVLTDHQNDSFVHAMEKLSQSDCLVYDDFGMSVPRISSIIDMQMRSVKKPRLVVIDYLQILKPSMTHKDMLATLQQISIEVKQIVMRHPVCILAIAQFNREADQGMPELSHIRGNDSFAHDCDAAILWHTDAQSISLGGGFCKLRKMRYGREAQFPVAIDFSCSKITDMDKSRIADFMFQYRDSRKSVDGQQKYKSFSKRYTGRSHTGTVD